MSWLLSLILQWAWGSSYLFEIVISFPLDMYPEMGLLDHMVVLYLIFFLNLFIYFYLFIVFGCIGSSLLCAAFSLVAASGGYSSLWCAGFSLQWLLLLQSTGSRRVGFSSCGAWASVVLACGLSSCGSWALECRLSSCGARA